MLVLILNIAARRFEVHAVADGYVSRIKFLLLEMESYYITHQMVIHLFIVIFKKPMVKLKIISKSIIRNKHLK
jgi:hypothetical protein